jgi:hypothetical protein
MALKDLKADELKEVAEYFVVDVPAADEENPTKKELLAALASGDDPVSWNDYNELFLPNKAKFEAALAEEKEEREELEEAAKKAAEEAAAKESVEEEDTSNYMVVKYNRKNPRFDVAGMTFTKAHPYRSVHPDTAAYLIRNVDGFTLALPEEVADYYGTARS